MKTAIDVFTKVHFQSSETPFCHLSVSGDIEARNVCKSNMSIDYVRLRLGQAPGTDQCVET
jgi:hypothetical protein